MSGIAEVLLNLGYQVSGSDAKRSALAVRLKRKGAAVHFSHRAEYVGDANVVVISSAVPDSNPEVTVARARGIPVIRRAEMLAELMRLKYGICVSGSHGKTTTTSLVATLLDKGGLDPTVVIGGKVAAFRGNARLGKGKFFVAEADESDGSFLRAMPTLAVVTNIDPEHLDHYGSFTHLQEAFAAFMSRVPFYGAVVGCVEHPVVAQLLKECDRPVLTYGLSNRAHVWARDIQFEGLRSRFVVCREDVKIGEIALPLSGLHNVLNALAAIAVGLHLDVPFAVMAKALAGFKGIDRRTELYLESPLAIIDDYGHHPEEIRATLSAVRGAYPDRPIKVCFQPHRYSRTHQLFRDFVEAFADADHVILCDIYGAGEENQTGVSGRALYEAIAKRQSASFVGDPVKEWKAVAAQLAPHDVCVTLGAGSVGALPRYLAAHFRAAGNPR